MAAVLVSLACGIVGSFVVVKRIVFISGGITHAAFGGIGLGYLLGVNPILMAIPFSIAAALILGMITEKMHVSEDSAIGILWTVGMALGVLFVSLAPGYAPDLFSYLFGSILTVPFSDIIIMLVLDLIIILVTLVFYKELHAMAFDEEFAEIRGVPVKLLNLLLLSMVALSVVLLIKVVGIILVIALLTIPTVIVRQYSHNLKNIIIYSMCTAVIFTVMGLWLSYVSDLPSGATIVLLLALGFFVSLLIHRHVLHRNKGRHCGKVAIDT